MKHVANRRKIVSPLPRKSFSQPKTAEKKSANAVAVKSAKKVPVKAVAAKSAPIVSARSVKANAVPKKAAVVGKTSKTPVAISKNKAVTGKVMPVAGKQISKPTAKKTALKTVAVPPKAKAKNSKPAVVPVKNKPAKTIAAQIEKPKAKKSAPKNIPVKPVKTAPPVKAKTLKSQPLKSRVQTAKVEKPAAKKIAAKSVVVEEAKKATKKVAAEKRLAAAPKAKPTMNAKRGKAVQEKPKNKPVAAVKEVVKTHKNKPLIEIEKTVQPAKKAKLKLVEVAAQPKAQKQKEIIAPKAAKANTPKVKREKIKIAAPVKVAPTKKIKAVEPPVEAVEVIAAPIPKLKKKKVKPLGAAIFRGKKERYDFQVFPIEGEFEDAAAIFIISRRVVDRNKRAHHRMVCIGQTDSVLSEIKKHRKGKCFKKYEANAISVLREGDEQKRLKIESDLKSAHTIPCPHA